MDFPTLTLHIIGGWVIAVNVTRWVLAYVIYIMMGIEWQFGAIHMLREVVREQKVWRNCIALSGCPHKIGANIGRIAPPYCIDGLCFGRY